MSIEENKLGGSAESQLYHKAPSDEIVKPSLLKACSSQPNLLDELKEEQKTTDKKKRSRRRKRGNNKSN